MDLVTVFIVSTFLSVTAGNPSATLRPTNDTVTAPTRRTDKDCSCPPVPTSATVASNCPAPVLGLLTVNWTRECGGNIILITHLPLSGSLPVCHSQKNLQTILGNVCQNKKGCKGTPEFSSRSKMDGYDITEKGATKTPDCKELIVKCEVEIPQVDGQLTAYKVVTGLLCCVLLILLLIRFTRPTVKALQKRLSDRRQNRWIGPTQSHSVSYHRGKTAVKTNDGDKRLSYPALELLVISDSREF
ncbi:uncharacterized protein cd5 [Stegastes partitus]|uniref:Uncharacterized protein cd5 n=1 Tax=Stegastes partitus TaxID=144197 RepID=A0A9Y4U1C3_9TELE|nr:PREDICTED: uncharacterized protein LOC103373014 [Stegastes partitus]